MYNLCSERLYDASLFEGKVCLFSFIQIYLLKTILSIVSSKDIDNKGMLGKD